ncbi:MAG: extracellular solute-binding protein [Acidimicrobiia bacterium]
MPFAALVALLPACGGDDGGTPTLTWYYNPDNGGVAEVARQCTEAAGGAYRIETSVLPNDATNQREQLVRRLAAEDDSIDLMSLDVVFVPEFANAGFLRPFTDDEAEELTEGILEAPIESATFDDVLYAAPFHANTQLLWYRRSVAERAGLDLDDGPVTWAQIVEAARETDTTVAVQANRYEGYMVWINALVLSGGGEILDDPEAGRDVSLTLDSDAGRAAAEVIRSVAGVAPPDLDTATEEPSRTAFLADDGGFLVNWPYTLGASEGSDAHDDIGWARYPEVVEGEPSAPPLGGIHIGVGAFSRHPDLAVEATRCITSVEGQTTYMTITGNPAAAAAVYDDPEVQEQFPMADLIRESIDDAGPRPLSPFYNDISTATVDVFHPAHDVDPARTPGRAADRVARGLANVDRL